MTCPNFKACSTTPAVYYCSCLMKALESAYSPAKDWPSWAARHGYVHAGYLEGKPHLVKAQVRR